MTVIVTLLKILKSCDCMHDCVIIIILLSHYIYHTTIIYIMVVHYNNYYTNTSEARPKLATIIAKILKIVMLVL